MSQDISDLYIKFKGSPAFDDSRLENTTFLDTVVAKIYMILLTNKGEILGDPDFGGDIPKYLWKTRFPATTIQQNLQKQFQKYIPELSTNDYRIKVYIVPGKISDIGVISIDLGIVTVNSLFK